MNDIVMTGGVTVPSYHVFVSRDMKGCFCDALQCREHLYLAMFKDMIEEMLLLFFRVRMYIGKRFCLMKTC